MKDLLEHIDILRKQFDELKPLSDENQLRLNKKFRLEWNFNSNHIEGNTLTYGETELLIFFDQTKGNHEFREYEEMKGHDLALKLIEDLSADKERNLTENFIRELNKVILKEPFYKEAITPDGQATRRLIKIGDYKSFPNSVRLQNGEMFNYASPAETPILMADLLNWYHKVCEEKKLSAIEIAAGLHYKFVCIHPFDDGNGRISRLIMNYHLLKNGHPPVIIKSADKKNYLFALREADTGNLGAFQQYIGEQLVWSYEISIKAARGENIDEVGDWEKKVELLKRQTAVKPKAIREKNKKVIIDLFENSFVPLTKNLLSKIKLLEQLFLSSSFTLTIDSNNKIISQKTFEEMVIEFPNNINDNTDRITFNHHLANFQENGVNTFDSFYGFKFYFSDLTYSITINNETSETVKKLNSEYLTEEEIDSIVSIITEKVYSEIEQRIKS